MNVIWENLADCLRGEIAEYGGLLGLFEEQQRCLFARDADAVLRLSSNIEAQVRVLRDCRRRREEAVAAFATAHGHPATVTLRSLLPQVAADVRPLLEALINEVNHLIHRVRRTSRHNHTLLARAVETHQEILRQLRPDAFVKTYGLNGSVSVAGTRPASALQAAG